MTELTLELPLPNESMSGHAKGHWRAKSNATKRMRQTAWATAINALNGRAAPKWAQAVVSFDIFLPTRGRRDILNVIGSGCKPYVDGIVDAEIIADDDWKALSIGSIRCGVDRLKPRVVVTLRPAGGEGER